MRAKIFALSRLLRKAQHDKLSSTELSDGLAAIGLEPGLADGFVMLGDGSGFATYLGGSLDKEALEEAIATLLDGAVRTLASLAAKRGVEAAARLLAEGLWRRLTAR